jgi:Kef-type K+ transport system membrane component KefB
LVFFGHAFFIPIFFAMAGFLIDPTVLPGSLVDNGALVQVATTLAATLVGFHTFNRAGQRLIDGRILDAVFALVLTTAILGPALTEYFAPHMLEAPGNREARNAREA